MTAAGRTSDWDDVPTGGSGPAGGALGSASGSLGRDLLFVASFLLAWVTLAPFPSLSDARWLDPENASVLSYQAAYVIYAGLGGCAAVVLLRSGPILASLKRPVYLLTIGWLGVSVVTSQHPDLSARRALFAAVIVLLGAVAPLLPASRERFCDLLAGLAVSILFLCYAGVALAPDHAIHQVTDLVEPRLAGNWRGLFNHKNVAGEMMGIFVFIGLFVARVRSLLLGAAIVAAALVFLFFTEAKAAMGFLPLTLLLAWSSRRRWMVRLRLVLFLVAIGALNVLSVGSLMSPQIASVTDRLISDPTFTGRTEIWQVALDHIPKRLLFGYGYGGFWQTDEIMYAEGMGDDGAATTADHAHNAFLNLAVTTGIPGAVLGALWAIVLPISDIERCVRGGADPALTNLFLRIWAFAVANCSFESILFARGDPMWFAMLIALFGLRYLSVHRLSRDGPVAGAIPV